ncbi:MAG: hypothetical protein SO135_02110 [Sphaerochaetaceae bacterium]|nr:hypothetical protein [Sphaerochaetaceae bacterium]NLY07905.1 hypothetical protein [Spirochaetales bacterium]
MKKIISTILMLLAATMVFAQGVAEVTSAEKFRKMIVEKTIDGNHSDITVISDEDQVFVFHISENTVTNKDVELLVPGSMVLVGYSGAATRSIPPQATAQQIIWEGHRSLEVKGNFETVMLNSIDWNNSSMVVTDTQYNQEKIYHFDEKTVWEINLTDLKVNDVFRVKNNGIMTMSIPPQSYAQRVFK